MTKEKDSHAEMAHARQSDGINVIFDQNSPASPCSHSSRSCSSDRSSGSGHHRGRASHRGRYRSSSSSSSSSRSSSHPRSRSHPRCHRRSSRCRCDSHHRYGRGRYRRSPSRRYRAHSRSYSRLPSRHRSRSGSPSRSSRHREAARRFGSKLSQSPSKTYRSRSRSRSRSSGRSNTLSLNDKRKLLNAARENALKILGVEELELPECVKPILSVESVESKPMSPEPWTRVRQGHEKTPSQSSEVEPEMSSPKMSPNRKIITFSINNLVVKPSVAAPSCAKVTPRVDIYESRKPYGHWVPVKTGKTSKARKHNMSH